jgi:hypothetical protein
MTPMSCAFFGDSLGYDLGIMRFSHVSWFSMIDLSRSAAAEAAL